MYVFQVVFHYQIQSLQLKYLCSKGFPEQQLIAKAGLVTVLMTSALQAEQEGNACADATEDRDAFSVLHGNT